MWGRLAWMGVALRRDGLGSDVPPNHVHTTSRHPQITKQPYFWPSRRLPSWRMNRVRCVSTWLFVTGCGFAFFAFGGVFVYTCVQVWLW